MEEADDLSARVDALERLVDDEGCADLTVELGALLEREGARFEAEGDLTAAENRYDCAIARLDEIADEHALPMARACAGKARMLRARRETRAAADYYERADEMFGAALAEEGEPS